MLQEGSDKRRRDATGGGGMPQKYSDKRRRDATVVQ
jgi:hypothetical protein